jgi:hypothetical protein
MPALTLHLLALKDGPTNSTTFVKKLTESPGIKVIVASRPRHIVIHPTALDTNPLATQRWDLMLLLQQPQTQAPNQHSIIPTSLQSAICLEYRILVGVPSKLLATYPERDTQLKRGAPPPLTGSLEKIRSSRKETSQNLEVSPQLLAFMDELSKEHDKPVTMLNLLNFNSVGKQSYFQYGQVRQHSQI